MSDNFLIRNTTWIDIQDKDLFGSASPSRTLKIIYAANYYFSWVGGHTIKQ